MQSIIDRHYEDDPEYADIKQSQKQARYSGVAAVVIGSSITYVTLKLTKAFKDQPKYIPLVCCGVGACCGYIKSLSIIQEYKNQRKQRQQQEQNNYTEIEEVQTEGPLSQSKYGDKNFFKDEKSS